MQNCIQSYRMTHERGLRSEMYSCMHTINMAIIFISICTLEYDAIHGYGPPV